MALSKNGIVSLFTRNAPEISGIAFDAQTRHTFQSQSRITQYELENGATLNNHVVFEPATIEMEVAMGTTPLFSWGGLANSWTAGALSNVPGIGLIAGGLSSLLTGADSRGGAALEALLVLQNTAEELNLNVPHVGFFPRMVVVAIRHGREYESGQGDTFVVSFQQRKGESQQGAEFSIEDDSIKEPTSKGNAPTEEVV
jgi:hypothetical protein